MSIMRLYDFFCQEMTWMDKISNDGFISGRCSEERHFIKKDKQSIMIYLFVWSKNHIDE